MTGPSLTRLDGDPRAEDARPDPDALGTQRVRDRRDERLGLLPARSGDSAIAWKVRTTCGVIVRVVARCGQLYRRSKRLGR